MDSRRAESFSDGVFAVAITVLVFNLLAVADKTALPAALTVASHRGQAGLGHYWPRLSTFRFTIGNAGYIGGTLIALVWPLVALIIFGLLAGYYMVEHLPSEPAGSEEDAEPEPVTERS